jgi:hypothetical protein
VILSAPLGHSDRITSGNACSFSLASDGDSMSDAPLGDRPVGHPERSLNVADASPADSVFALDQVGQGVSGMKERGPIGCVHASTIVTIADASSTEELCDLSVDEDETYFADGVLVHNCRCQLTPLSQEEAEDEGIDDELPDTDIDEDFGAEPSRKGENWDFDLSGLDPELRAQVEESLDED